jgi:hypothetical protein
MNPLLLIPLVFVLHSMVPQVRIPGITPKPAAQKRVEAERDALKARDEAKEEQIKAISKEAKALIDKLNAEMDTRRAAEASAEAEKARSLKAANANAKTTTVFRQLHKPGNRLELVVALNAEEVAAAVGDGNVDQLETMRRSLDEALTSNEDLAAENQTNREQAARFKGAADQTAALLATSQVKLTEALARADEAIKTAKADGAAAKAAEGRASAEAIARQGLFDQLQTLARILGGSVALIGVIVTLVGAKLIRLKVMTAGVLVILVGAAVFLVPVAVYFWLAGGALAALVGYIAYHWHREQTGAQNAIGILQELREKAPEVWSTEVKPIAAQYWGGSLTQVAKANAYVTEHLAALNFLPKQ